MAKTLSAPPMSPTRALALLRPVADHFAAVQHLGEMLKAAEACERPAERLAELQAEIEKATAELAGINGDLGSVREQHQKMMGDLGADEVRRRREIEDEVAAARAEASNAINLARESAAAAEADAAAVKARVASDLAQANDELARTRQILSELKAALPG